MSSLGLLFAALLVCFPAHAAPVLLAIGDSLTAGYRLPATDAFPAQLEQALQSTHPGARVLNAGISGDTTAGGLARLDWALADNPDAVILELGANDALRGIPVQTTRDNLSAILDRLRQAKVPVLLAGMLAPPNMGPDYGAAFNAIFPDLARSYDTVFYPFFLDGVAAEPELNQADGMHPTTEGVGIIVERMLPSVYTLIEQIPNS